MVFLGKSLGIHKKEGACSFLKAPSYMARMEGVEPPTAWFVAEQRHQSYQSFKHTISEIAYNLQPFVCGFLTISLRKKTVRKTINIQFLDTLFRKSSCIYKHIYKHIFIFTLDITRIKVNL